jgi:transcriptional regulator with XRE-family HTH domain
LPSASKRSLSLPQRVSLPDLIRSGRKRQGLTQVRLAALLGVNKSAVAQWELGQTTPSVEKMSRLRDVLQIDRSSEPTTGLPNGYQFVEDDQKLALLRLFDLMDESERLIAFRMIRGAVSRNRNP